MDNALQIEPGEETVAGHCGTCGHETRMFRGFVFNADGAYAVYLGTYTAAHPERGLSMAVSLRGWGAGSDTTAKECVALEWRITHREPGCRVLDADDTSWAGKPILGRMLSRHEAMSSGRGAEAFAVTDALWKADPRLAKALNGDA
ncbi:hypothetical protein CF161_21276 [Pseudomonas sp. CF161]|nr:hypothetical protein CF161_21276 [Pseudomonas sp. CF161]